MLYLLQSTLFVSDNVVGDAFFDNVFSWILRSAFFVAILLYFVFALIIVRQIYVMKNTLITPIAPIILTVGFLHMFFAAGVGLLFLAIL